MIQYLNKAVCWLIGHDIHMRKHHPPDRAQTIFQVVCERCMESYGTKDVSHLQAAQINAKGLKIELEKWLINVIPERNKKRMYKKAKEMYG